MMGLPLLYGIPPRREESDRPREGASTHSASRAADKNIVVATKVVTYYLPRQSDAGCLDFVLGSLH